MVGPERIELSLPKEPDFESDASTNSATTPSTLIESYNISFYKSTLFYIFIKKILVILLLFYTKVCYN